MRPLLYKVAAALIAYGPIGVLLLSAADSIGIPLPAAVDALVIAIAVDSARLREPWHAWFTAALATFGSTAGSAILFQAASHGRRLLARAEPPPGKRQRFQEWFRRYGLLTIFLPAVLPIPLPLKVFVISAGAMHTPFGRFLVVLIAGRVIRYFGLAYLGVKLGQDAQGFLIRNGWTLAGVALAMAYALYLLIRLNDRRRRPAM